MTAPLVQLCLPTQLLLRRPGSSRARVEGLVSYFAQVAILGKRADVHCLIRALADLVVIEGRPPEAQSHLRLFQPEPSARQRSALAAQVVRHAELLALRVALVAKAQRPFRGLVLACIPQSHSMTSTAKAATRKWQCVCVHVRVRVDAQEKTWQGQRACG